VRWRPAASGKEGKAGVHECDQTPPKAEPIVVADGAERVGHQAHGAGRHVGLHDSVCLRPY